MTLEDLLQLLSICVAILIIVDQLIGRFLNRKGTFQERMIAGQLEQNQEMIKNSFLTQNRMLSSVLDEFRKR